MSSAKTPPPPLALATDSPFLREMLSNPIQFGEVYPKSSFAPTTGVREVQPGPPSPPPSSLALSRENAEAGPSTPPRAVPSVASHSPASALNGNANGNGTNGFIGPVAPPSLKSRLAPSTPGLQNGTAPHPSPAKTTPATNGIPTPSPRKGKARESDLPPLYPPIPIAALGWPAHLKDRKSSAGGLHNPSMACYANATLQVLLHTPVLIGIMEGHRECLLSSRRQFCFLCILRDLPHWSMKRYSPKEVHTNLGQIKKGFNRNRQEDAHEFFRFVTDALQNTALAGLPKTLPNALKHTTWVHRLWGGQVRSRVVCSKCLKPSDTFDYFLDLSLDCHSSKKTLGQMLQGYIKEEKLDGDNKYHCETCKSKAPATKSFRVSASPPILTLHLKRFSVNYNAYNGRARADKYTQHIDFPALLDLAPYMIEHRSPVLYRLFGVTCHRGAELRYGHYTSYVRGPSGQWWNCDDDDVSPVKLEAIRNDRSAYLLSYVRVDEAPPNSTTETPRANGVSHTPHSNGHTPSRPLQRSTASDAIADLLPSSPLKRKRDLEDEENTTSTSPFRRIRLSSPERPPQPNLFPSALDNGRTIPEGTFYSRTAQPPRSAPSTPQKAPEYGANGAGPSPKLSKSQKKKLKKKLKRERAEHGAPMPFAQGRAGGMAGMAGRLGRMQPKK